MSYLKYVNGFIDGHSTFETNDNAIQNSKFIYFDITELNAIKTLNLVITIFKNYN